LGARDNDGEPISMFAGIRFAQVAGIVAAIFVVLAILWFA
jgi:hypothetical protein